MMKTEELHELIKYLRERQKRVDRAIRSAENFQREMERYRSERRAGLQMVPESSGIGKEIATPGHDAEGTVSQ